MARTNCEQFLNKDQALNEIDAIKFAVSSLVQLLGKPGTFEQEVGANAARGIKQRLDYLHDSFSRLCS